MNSIPFINKHAIILAALALCMNGIFLYLYNPQVYFAITQDHGQIGYNLYKHNMLGLNPELTEYMRKSMQEQNQLVDYATITDQTFAQSTEPFPINDTVGYGVLLGLLWKLTGSLCFADAQLLQMSIFCILMFFYYQLAYLLFESAQVAFVCGIMQLLFFPLLAYNVMPVRDVWAYYGLLILLYALLSYLHNCISLVHMILCMLFFSICLWMRLTLSLATLLMSLLLGVYAYTNIPMRKRVFYFLATLWLVTTIFFWIPYMQYNYTHYNRLFVSPAGQSLLEGLGEIQNPWGHKLNDEYVRDFIGAKYNLSYGTVAFDEAAMHEFKACVKEHPWHYIKTLLYRLPDILLPGLQWIFYVQSPYVHCQGIMQKLLCAVSCLPNLIDFFLRHVWMRLYLLFGYMGMFLLARHKRWQELLFIGICLVSGLSTYPSHIEYRYIVPFYWTFSFCVGYALSIFMQQLSVFSFFDFTQSMLKRSNAPESTT